MRRDFSELISLLTTQTLEYSARVRNSPAQGRKLAFEAKQSKTHFGVSFQNTSFEEATLWATTVDDVGLFRRTPFLSSFF